MAGTSKSAYATVENRMGRVVRSAAFPSAAAGLSRSRSERAVTVNIIRRILVQSKPFLKHQPKAPEKAGRLRKRSKGMATALCAVPEGAHSFASVYK